jgi:hypothetical protein
MTVDGPDSPDIVGYQRKFLLTVSTLVSDNHFAEVPPENRGKVPRRTRVVKTPARPKFRQVDCRTIKRVTSEET